jgi:hypothetical protein
MRALAILALMLVTLATDPARAAETIAGDALTDPECQSIATGRVDCFWIGRGGPMHHWADAGSKGVEQMPVGNPGDFTGPPACAALTGFDFDCLARHRKGFLVRSVYRGGWSAWNPVPLPAGTRFVSDPSCVTLTASIACFIRSEDSKLYRIVTAVGAPDDWTVVGASDFRFNAMTVAGAPSCIDGGANNNRTILCTFAGAVLAGSPPTTIIITDTGGPAWNTPWNGPWTPTSLGGPSGAPVCGTIGDPFFTVCWHVTAAANVAANFRVPLTYDGAQTVAGAVVDAVGWCGKLDVPEAELTCLGRSVDGEIVWTAHGLRQNGQGASPWRPWAALTQGTGGNRKPTIVGLPKCVSRTAGIDCYLRQRDATIIRMHFDGITLD